MRSLASRFLLILTGMMLYALFWFGNAVISTRMPVAGAPAELYSTDTLNDLQLTFTQAIGKAEERVLLIVYTLKDRGIIKALRAAAQRGVDVQVICDAKASEGAERLLGPNVKTTMRQSKGLMHQKILAVDGKRVWIGSANMTPTSLKWHANLVAGFESAELAALVDQKADAMAKEGPVHPIPPREVNIGGQKVEMWFFPDNPEGAEKARKLIREAKKTVKIAMFTWTRLDLAEEVANAYRRGINVSVIMDRSSSSQTSKKVADYFIDSKIPIRVNKGTALLHHKCMVIDDNILVNGSANWTYSAFNSNDDCYTILHNLTMQQKKLLSEMWDSLLQDSEELLR